MEQTEYSLTEDEQGMIKPLVNQIELLQKEAQSILNAISRLRKLDGNWNLMGDKLVKMPNGNGNVS
jgi:hypothetical protein